MRAENASQPKVKNLKPLDPEVAEQRQKGKEFAKIVVTEKKINGLKNGILFIEVPSILELNDYYFNVKRFYQNAHTFNFTKESLLNLLNKNNFDEKPICVLVGPEGDFSEEEREKILKYKSVCSIKINDNILRSETAVISSLSIVNYAIS